MTWSFWASGSFAHSLSSKQHINMYCMAFSPFDTKSNEPPRNRHRPSFFRQQPIAYAHIGLKLPMR
jgi:hypothetical protein